MEAGVRRSFPQEVWYRDSIFAGVLLHLYILMRNQLKNKNGLNKPANHFCGENGGFSVWYFLSIYAII